MALLVVVVATTASDMAAGLRFARSRTVYVRGLENEIVTSGALLRARCAPRRGQPIWASGFAAGYLTTGVFARLYHERLVPRARLALMTPAEILNDDSWLDLTGRSGAQSTGRLTS